MSSDALVRRVDHFSVAVEKPDEVFAVLTAELGLPALWKPGPFAGLDLRLREAAVRETAPPVTTFPWIDRQSLLRYSAGA